MDDLREEAERRALSVVKWAGDNESGLSVALTPLQKWMLTLYIQDEILSRDVYMYGAAGKAEELKIAANMAGSVVNLAEKTGWGLCVSLTSQQREMLIERVRDEILRD